MEFVVNKESRKIHPEPTREECNIDDADEDNLEFLTAWFELEEWIKQGFEFCGHHDDE